jgi:hypothetical protein
LYNSLDVTVRHFRRVSVRSNLYLTVEVPGGATKDDILTSVQRTLCGLVDINDRIRIDAGGDAANMILYVPTKEERTIDEAPIFVLRGLEVIDAFEQEENTGSIPPEVAA